MSAETITKEIVAETIATDTEETEHIDPMLLIMALGDEITRYQEAAIAEEAAKQEVVEALESEREAQKALSKAKARLTSAKSSKNKKTADTKTAKSDLLEAFHELIVPDGVTGDNIDISDILTPNIGGNEKTPGIWRTPPTSPNIGDWVEQYPRIPTHPDMSPAFFGKPPYIENRPYIGNDSHIDRGWRSSLSSSLADRFNQAQTRNIKVNSVALRRQLPELTS